MGNTIAKKYKIRFPAYSGRKRKFTPEDFTRLAGEYAAHCSKEDRVPTVTGYALHCGISHEGLQYYERKDEYRPVIKFVKDCICDEKFQQAYKGKIDVRVFTIDVINHHRKINARSHSDNKTEITDSSGKSLADVLGAVDSGGLQRKGSVDGDVAGKELGSTGNAGK